MPLFKHVPFDPPSSTPCPIAFVGEAPGDTECARGHPLVGPAGKMFGKLLGLAGIERSACWVGNVFDEKIPDNDLRNWCVSAKDGVAGNLERAYFIPRHGYLRPDYHWHLDRLHDELSNANPAVIVPLGGTALWAFTGSVAIAELRGVASVAERIVPGAKILPTFHPMYASHQFKAVGTIVSDLKKAWSEAQGLAKSVKRSARELWLDPSVWDIVKFVSQHLKKARLIACDTETKAGQITEVSFGEETGEHAICIPFVDYRKPGNCYWPSLEDELTAWEHIRLILDMPQPKLGQNFPYDLWYFLRYGIKVRNYREDTRLLSHALYPEEPKGLGYMASRYAQESAWKSWHKGDVKRDS